MMWSSGPWELVILLSKVLSYISLASLTGGIFVLWLMSRVSSAGVDNSPFSVATSDKAIWPVNPRRRIAAVLIAASVTGALSAILYFLLQIGLINQSGIAGMFDPLMIDLVVRTNVGYGVGLKLLGFLIAGLAVMTAGRDIVSPDGFKHVPPSLIAGGVTSAVLFSLSFSVVGHVADLNALAHVAIALHIAAIGLWLGAFYPLHTLSRDWPDMAGTEDLALQRLLHVFGQFGWGITGMLLVAGGYLVIQFFVDSGTFFGSIYGRVLTLKILLVCCLLALAATNKFRLVGALQSDGTARLRRSIAGEMGLALLVLVLTAVMTTFTGPAHLM